MSESTLPKFDEIGIWSEVKLEILKAYAQQYSLILNAPGQSKFHPIYIDGFAGAGVHVSKTTGKLVPGSPLNALAIQPPFEEIHLIDLDGSKIEHLRRVIGGQSNVFLYEGNCNEILLRDVFPRVRYEEYRRALCLLDPYGLHLDWQVVEQAGKLGTIDLFLNFPILDMNRNALWSRQEGVSSANIERMNAFWGDNSWRKVAFRPPRQLSFLPVDDEKVPNEVIVEAYRQRLIDKAGFKFVPEALPMKNSTGNTVYYLIFASQKDVARKIAAWILKNYGEGHRR